MRILPLTSVEQGCHYWNAFQCNPYRPFYKWSWTKVKTLNWSWTNWKHNTQSSKNTPNRNFRKFLLKIVKAPSVLCTMNIWIPSTLKHLSLQTSNKVTTCIKVSSNIRCSHISFKQENLQTSHQLLMAKYIQTSCSLPPKYNEDLKEFLRLQALITCIYTH